MYGLRLLSEAIPGVAGKVFSRKYIMLGRLVTNWTDIVGPEYAATTQPVKIRYIKSRKADAKSTASLDIACTSADATLLHYKIDLILERINQIFGDRWITAIRFVPQAANAPDAGKKKVLPRKPLTEAEKQHLSTVLESVQDPDLVARLKSLGSAILQDKRS